jgi:hypothetical protein
VTRSDNPKEAAAPQRQPRRPAAKSTATTDRAPPAREPPRRIPGVPGAEHSGFQGTRFPATVPKGGASRQNRSRPPDAVEDGQQVACCAPPSSGGAGRHFIDGGIFESANQVLRSGKFPTGPPAPIFHPRVVTAFASRPPSGTEHIRLEYGSSPGQEQPATVSDPCWLAVRLARSFTVTV